MLSDADKEIILTLADNNMNISSTAKSLFMHRNTVVYHLGKVKKVTGLDPMNFYDLIKLVSLINPQKLREEELLCGE